MSYQQLLIYILFFFSGISGLIYETIWLRILGRILGNTIYATSIVLAVFMAGMALGSYIIGKYADKYGNHLKLYAALEVGIGLSAICLYYVFNELIPLYKFVYLFFDENRIILTVFQITFLFIILLIPTTLMGGTLPLLTAYTKNFRTEFTNRIGNLYGLNTLGAVIGVMGSGFYTIGELGELNTVFIGVTINFLVSFISLYMGRIYFQKNNIITDEKIKLDEKISPYSPFIRKMVVFTYGINGFIAIAYEIVWTRMLQLHLGTSIYSFSMMLGIYLLGVSIGSLTGGKLIKRIKDPLAFFGLSQLFVALYSIIALHVFILFRPSCAYINISNIIVIPLIIVFPITFIFGLIFPAVSKSYIANENLSGSGVSFLYSSNTIGAITGSLVCGFIFISLLGTKDTILILALLNIILGFCIVICSEKNHMIFKYSTVTICIILCVFLAIKSPDPFLKVINTSIDKYLKPLAPDMEIYYHNENTVATTTVLGSKTNPLVRELLINGVGMTHLATENKLMAHIPILLHNNPEDMLIVCMGMGTTLRSAIIYENIKCDVVELVPEVYECYKYFHADGDKILSDARVNYNVDDGRNFLLMNDKLYDIITIDPAPPLWSSGTVNLYSKEFFELCKTRLKPGGIMCLWVMPASYSDIRMIMATAQIVFPDTIVFQGPKYAGFYVISSLEPLKINKEQFLKANMNKNIVFDLIEWENVIPKPENILDLYILNEKELAEFSSGSLIITDNNPYTEFPIWTQMFDKSNDTEFDGFLLNRWKQEFYQH